MKKFFKVFLILLFAATVVGTFVFLYQKSAPKEEQYELLSVVRTDIARTSILTGSIEARDEVAIKPQISGIIAELYKQAGERVSKGEVIAKIKVIPEMNQLNAAENRVKLAQLNLAQSRRDFERSEQLYREKIISTEEFEKAQLALRSQQEELRTAQDALQITREGASRAQADQSSTLIRSTIDGLILDIPVKVGNAVVMSNSFNDGTTIATVANMNDLVFRGTIDETEVAQLHEGMPLNITVGALPNEVIPARLEFIAPKVKSGNTSNQFEIRAALTTKPSQALRSGYSANAEVTLQAHQAVLAVPEAAVEFEGERSFVQVLVSSKDEQPQRFERKAVRTGISNGVVIELLTPLKVGTKLRGKLQQ